MVTVDTARGPFRVIDVFYPRPEEIDGVGENLSLNEIIHIRQAPLRLPARRFAIRYQTFETLLFDLTGEIDELLSHANRTGRYQVRKIERLRDRIVVRRNDDMAYKDFVAIYNDFVKVKKHTEQISKMRLDELKPFSDVFVTYFEGRPICGHVMIRDQQQGRVGLLWSASTRLTGKDAPVLVASLNRWSHWHEMRLYRSEGFRVYDFGGIGEYTSEIAAIARFKLSFGGTRVVEHNYVVARAPGRLAVSLLYGLRRFRQAMNEAFHKRRQPNTRPAEPLGQKNSQAPGVTLASDRPR
jgi:hypothetical protein